MATYAAYRHVELDNVGYGKKRVLKPPGGGSSDIFGANESTSPRRTKQSSQASSLSSAFFGKSVNGNVDSPMSSISSTPSSNGCVTDGPVGARMAVNNNKPDGNPVTGAGYEAIIPSSPLPNGTSNGTSAASSSAGSEKSSTDSSPSVQPVQRLKNRVPPGGFSSGLW